MNGSATGKLEQNQLDPSVTPCKYNAEARSIFINCAMVKLYDFSPRADGQLPSRQTSLARERWRSYLYDLEPGKRDVFIDRALQIKPGDDGIFPNRSDRKAFKGKFDPDTGNLIDPRIPNPIKTIEDFQVWAKDRNYVLPSGS